MVRAAFGFEQDGQGDSEAALAGGALELLEENAVRLAAVAHRGHRRIEPRLALFPKRRVARGGDRGGETRLQVFDFLLRGGQTRTVIFPDEKSHDEHEHGEAQGEQRFLRFRERAGHRIFPLISKVAEPSAAIVGCSMLHA